MRGEQTINVPSLGSIIGSSPPILFTLHAISYNNYHHRSFSILQTINLCARILYDSRESFQRHRWKKGRQSERKTFRARIFDKPPRNTSECFNHLTASTSKFLKYEEDSSSEAKWTRRSFPRLRKRRYQEFFILVFPPTLTPALECYAPSNQPPFSFHPCIHPTAIRREPPFPMVTIYSGDA